MIAELRAMMLVISATYSPSCVASSDGCASGLELSELQGEQLERVLARLMRPNVPPAASKNRGRAARD
jgi:hypothetical protein